MKRNKKRTGMPFFHTIHNKSRWRLGMLLEIVKALRRHYKTRFGDVNGRNFEFLQNPLQ